MLVLGLQGSPRRKGNTSFLLGRFMEESRQLGANVETIDVCRKNILACKELVVCEKKGICPIEDDMTPEVYPLLWKADVVVAATPIFFYNTTAQLKALIDRTQTLWARKYRLKLTDPGRPWRKGFFLGVGATKGKNLFEGVELTMKYFFDAVGAEYKGSLTYRQIEKPGDMEKHPTVREDVQTAVKDLLRPLISRTKILFACRENACRSQMASAFARYLGGDRIDAYSAGSEAASQINPLMVEVMQERGIDMGFRKTTHLDEAISEMTPDIIVTMGCNEQCPYVPGCRRLDWDLPDPAGKSKEFMRKTRDAIEEKIKTLICEVTG
jgi:arsenate reductase (thioredoxin)